MCAKLLCVCGTPIGIKVEILKMLFSNQKFNFKNFTTMKEFFLKGSKSARVRSISCGVSDHGVISQNSRYTRVVFEFPLHMDASKISSALDDEVYETRDFLNQIGQ